MDVQLPIERAVHSHLHEIISRIWPDAVLSGRTALAGGEAHDGWLFLSHPDPPRKSDLSLPGLTITCTVGPGPLPGDTSMPRGIYLAGIGRSLIENVTKAGRPPRRVSRTAGTSAVGDKIDDLARSRGLGYVRTLMNEVELIAQHFDGPSVEVVKRDLRAVLGTVQEPIASERLSARVAGTPYDAHRLHLFDVLLTTLQDTAPSIRPTLGQQDRFQWLPFFEAYFSNYIEGTVFELDEAREIVMEGKIPLSRPADAHDVSATYRIVSDETGMRQASKTSIDFKELLKSRHAVLMAGRSDKRPGEFKEIANSAGGYRFVEPPLLEGTLNEGFGRLERLTDPFHRAVFVMFLVTECHPFDDGNGRIARIMANAELVRGGQIRIVIPTVFRDNYLSALSGMSNLAGGGESLISVLDFSRAWVAATDWSSWESASADLESSNARLEPRIAEQSGLRLRLPK